MADMNIETTFTPSGVSIKEINKFLDELSGKADGVGSALSDSLSESKKTFKNLGNMVQNVVSDIRIDFNEKHISKQLKSVTKRMGKGADLFQIGSKGGAGLGDKGSAEKFQRRTGCQGTHRRNSWTCRQVSGNIDWKRGR